MKFGGTSMGSSSRIRIAADICTSQKGRPVLAVVSAMTKITDLLLEAMRHAEAGDSAGLQKNLDTPIARHHAACAELLPVDRQAEVISQIDALNGEFLRIAHGMLMLG